CVWRRPGGLPHQARLAGKSQHRVPPAPWLVRSGLDAPLWTDGPESITKLSRRRDFLQLVWQQPGYLPAEPRDLGRNTGYTSSRLRGFCRLAELRVAPWKTTAGASWLYCLFLSHTRGAWRCRLEYRPFAGRASHRQ